MLDAGVLRYIRLVASLPAIHSEGAAGAGGRRVVCGARHEDPREDASLVSPLREEMTPGTLGCRVPPVDTQRYADVAGRS